jgi:hypothetical protein
MGWFGSLTLYTKAFADTTIGRPRRFKSVTWQPWVLAITRVLPVADVRALCKGIVIVKVFSRLSIATFVGIFLVPPSYGFSKLGTLYSNAPVNPGVVSIPFFERTICLFFRAERDDRIPVVLDQNGFRHAVTEPADDLLLGGAQWEIRDD